jgi:hypothetical protein
MFRERLKFYADTPMASNKYFCWKLDSILSLKEALWRFFDKGWNIRSAWYERINLTTGEVEENTKLDVQKELAEYCDEKMRNKKRGSRPVPILQSLELLSAQNQKDFFSGKDEVELTEELIKTLVAEKKWGSEFSLKEFAKTGAKWNTKRNSIVFPDELI